MIQKHKFSCYYNSSYEVRPAYSKLYVILVYMSHVIIADKVTQMKVNDNILQDNFNF